MRRRARLVSRRLPAARPTPAPPAVWMFAPVLIFAALVSLVTAGRLYAEGLTHADSAAIAESYFDQGVDEYNPGRLDSALVMFDMALRWDSLSAPAWQAKGATLARLMRHDEAQRAFDAALRIRPDYLTAWWHRGCDNAVAGRVEEALSDLRQAIAIDSTARSWPFEDACWDSLRSDPRLLEFARQFRGLRGTAGAGPGP
jgi:tetratricopeptide (TPR) repeat protein